MDFQNTLLAATVGLLTCPDECLDDALARCDGLFDSNDLYSIDKPSVAVRSGACVIPLREWIMRARAGGSPACRLGFDGQSNENTPEHMMAGFLGGIARTLYVRHDDSWHSYRTGTISSARHAMSVAQFADLINAQANPEFFWQKILADINEFHNCNDIAEVEPEELTNFLLSNAGASAWDFIGDEIMREIQVEALTFDEPFTIPAHLVDVVGKVVPFHDRIPYIWLDAYDEDQVTGSHLYQLIIAQPFHAEIWRQCADPRQLAAILGENYDLTEFPQIDVGRWGHYLQSLDAIEAELVRDDLLELIRLECQRRGCEPLIPAVLKKIFGPDEEEHRRLSFRARLQHDMGWQLKRNPASWRMYVFDEDKREVGAGGNTAAISKLDQQQRFEAALEDIGAFALRVESPFALHFQLAKSLAAQARADVPFSRAVFERICASDNAVDCLPDTELVDLFAAFGWGTRRVMGLAAIAVADVFSTMGSWNDQSFDGDENDDEDENAQFETVSSQLFCAMNDYLASLLTVDLRKGHDAKTPVQMLTRRWRNLLPGAE